MAQKKTVDYRSGSALLKKQLADRAGKKVSFPSKKNVKNLTDLGVIVGSILAPAAGGAAKGASVAKAAKTAIAKKTPYVKVTTGTQGKNMNINLKTPGAKKSGSPKTGTKARVQKVVNPRRGESGQVSAARLRAEKKRKQSLAVPAAAVTGYQVRKEQEKSKKRGK